MTRSILTLGLVTALFAGAALMAVRNKESKTAAVASETGPLFPALEGRVNDVTEVTITGQEGPFTVRREGDAWGAVDKGGYPIDFSRVKTLVVAVAGFDVVEAKTANAAYHDRLGVEAPEAPESESKRLVLKDTSGTVLADVIVGDARSARGGQPSLYARRTEEDQSYEVTGRLTVDATAANWLDRQIAALPQERVAAVTITHPDGEVLSVSRAAAEDTNYEVAGLPEGRELVWDGVARSVATAVQSLSLEDVGGEDLFDFDSAETTVAEYRTFDGLVLTATTAQVEETTYLRLTARAEELPQPPAPPPAPDEAGEAGEAGEGEAPAETEDELKPFAEVQAEAEEINARTGGWTYVVPGWAGSNLRKRMDELLKPLEAPSATAVDGAALPEDLPEGLEEAIQEALSNEGGGQ